MACLWFFQAKLSNFPSDCWVHAEDLIDADPGRQYLVAFYWAFQTLTTVGYGDVTVGTDLEKILAVCWMIFGVGFYSYTIGNMTSMIASFDEDNQELQN